MSSPDVDKSRRNAPESEENDKSDSEPPPPKKLKKKPNCDSDGSNPDKKVRKVDVSEEEEGEHSDKDEIKEERAAGDKSKSNRKAKDKEDRGKDSERGRDRDYERRRDRHRKSYEEYERDPPANFERYWGAGPKRSNYHDRDRRRRDDSDRDYDRYHDQRSGRGKGREVSGKVGPRYYGGKDDDSEPGEARKSENEDGKGPTNSSKDGNKTEEAISKPAKIVDMLTSRTGGAYIPPARLRMMQAQITDKSSAAYQRIAWEALKKSIHGHINKVNTGNLATVIRELLQLNLVRGCGLLCRSIIQAQAASPTFTRVFAALISVINSRVCL